MLSFRVASFRKQFTSFHTEFVITILILCQIATKLARRALHKDNYIKIHYRNAPFNLKGAFL
jgi:hypothetical protein